ncbi:Dot/Icm secretion system substrate [Legionella lansingensis]|uniref:Substrate of the Dot/Icm secretion system n=1 Tax=Legionella lansingensis TaxID=45067 RepID=A0A0W0VLH8_9GAMM|nr:hypothetical protein [Legionella lansingensis]KTD21007.1 substrate of the Dot/Icm secretion system [Legionella lansingensis]SNV44947.1 Dot/Icm secretion system substrate [Legionella lansingensis]
MKLRHEKDSLPSVEALVQCKEVATRPESANYFRDRFKNKVERAGMSEKGKDAIAHVEAFAETVRLQREFKFDPWAGVSGPLSDFHNLQHNMAEEAAKKVASNVKGPITMNFAISDKSEFVRANSVDGKPIDKDSNQGVDKLFNAWLAENNMISKESVIYQGNEKGQILHDSKDEPLRANPEDVRQMVSDKTKGFPHFLEQFNKDGQEIQVTPRLQRYPEQKPEAAKAAATAAEAEAPTPPETPSGGHTAPAA